MKLVDRLIFMEIVPMFFGGILAFTGLILGAGALNQIMKIAMDNHINVLWVIKIFYLKLPEIVSYTLPMSTLFCVLLGFNRFSNDLEITAFRAGGVSFVRLMAPVLLFGFVVSIVAVLLNDRLVPMSNNRFDALLEKVKKSVQKENFEYTDWKDGKVSSQIYARSIQGKRLVGLRYTEMKDGRIVRETLAEEAVWENNYWGFSKGTQLLYNDTGELKNIVKFNRMNIIFKQKLDEIAREKTRAGDYTYRQLKERIALFEQRNADKGDLRKLKFEFNSKLAIPFASLMFVMIAAPLGLKPVRASSSVGFGLSVIIIFIYYISQALFRGLGQSVVNPALAAWLPNIMLATIGTWLTYKASK
jgi:lipopolysaccharide export system permease protein